MQNSINQRKVAAIKPRFKAFPQLIVIGLLHFTIGCVMSMEEEINLAPSLREDQAYNQALNNASSQFEVIRDFETKYTVQATHISPGLKKALAKRHHRLYGTEQQLFPQDSPQKLFFISLYTANTELNDLGNQAIWSLQLKHSDQGHSPIRIKKLSNKEKWQPFFRGISPWTKEYLVSFDQTTQVLQDAPQSDTNTLPQDPPIQLSLSNADGRVVISW